MLTRKVLGLGLIAAAGTAGSAFGQTVTVPTAYMWAPFIPDIIWPGSELGDLSNVTPMVHVDGNSLTDGGGTFDLAAYPFRAGQWAAGGIEVIRSLAEPSARDIEVGFETSMDSYVYDYQVLL